MQLITVLVGGYMCTDDSCTCMYMTIFVKNQISCGNIFSNNFSCFSFMKYLIAMKTALYIYFTPGNKQRGLIGAISSLIHTERKIF